MKIANLHIKNFLTVGDASVELDDRGLLLIQGVNNDDPSAKSNGAGKSSVVDAICWALYGTTARGVTGDAVVNDTAKKDCHVFVMLEDGGTYYKIERYRKDSAQKNQLLVFQMPSLTGTSTDLSKGTDKETQEVVNKIMGCTPEVFMAAVYAGQERMPDLPGMTDKMLKTLIEEAAGVEVLTEAYAVARDRSNKAQAELASAQAVHTAADANLALLFGQIADTESSAKAFEDGRKTRAMAELTKIKPLNAALRDVESKLTAFDVPKLTVRKGALDAELTSHKTQEAELAALNRVERAAGDKVTRFKSTLDVQKAGVTKQEQALTGIESQVGKPCGECGKEYCAHDLETVKTMRVDAVASAKKALLEAAKGCKTALEEHRLAQEAVATFKASMTDVTAAIAELRAISTELETFNALTRSKATVENSIAEIKKAAGKLLEEPNPWTKVLEDQNKRAEQMRAELEISARQIEELENKAAIMADAVKVFGPAGVRAHILDTVTPYLNEQTREYLGALADGNIHATWATLTKTAKGDLKEKFNIEVTNDKGAKSFAGMSGGEKRKVRLATAMALQDMVASRATKPIGIFIADEVDHALDESGLERLMGVLERKARERGTVLVISHNALGDWIPNVITVSKTAGIAEVSGATERGF